MEAQPARGYHSCIRVGITFPLSTIQLAQSRDPQGSQKALQSLLHNISQSIICAVGQADSIISNRMVVFVWRTSLRPLLVHFTCSLHPVVYLLREGPSIWI